MQCIYFDPPYGIKFGSNWQVSTRKRDVKDAKAEDLTRQPEQIKAFRDTWELGIHSYLAYLRDRLAIARALLTESGSIFVQIGTENSHLVQSVIDEVFGSNNRVAQISYRTTTGRVAKHINEVYDHLLWYAGDYEQVKTRLLYRDKHSDEEHFNRRDEQGRRYSLRDLSSQGTSDRTPFFFQGREFIPPPNRSWSVHPSKLPSSRIEIAGMYVRVRMYWEDFPVAPLNNWWEDTQFAEQKIYVVQTASKVIQRCLLMTTDPGDLVLDPTCGSGTTAYVAEQWGRRWITIDTSRVALALTRTRLMAARFPYYLLADSVEGRKKHSELTGTPPDPHAPTPQRDMHRGFVYRTVPHVTLKSIANNPDIREGMTREAIDRAIAKHADTETLYDQPYEDKDIVRLTGPFTVESLSPHRSLPAQEQPKAEAASSPVNFAQMILDNLRTAGVKGTDKSQRINFARLDNFPGEYIQAEGETDTGAAVRVCIGPEFGTFGDSDIKKAALEAVKGSKCDLLLVCAFAFEASVHEQTAELTKEIKFGKLAVLPVRMNPDLAMGDELLKKTGAGNLFTVFGEPDVKLTTKDGKMIVEIRGVDVFDPSTGAVRTGDTDDIACWFIDTDYDGQSFFVRHAYFLYGGKDTKEGPYDKLKRALRAEIDEGEWSKLYSATSQPFDPPKSGKIAVKVINHFGDEVLKVYPVPTPTARKSK